MARLLQGCQIFLDTIYQNGEKCTKLTQQYLMTIKYAHISNGRRIFQMTLRYTNIFNSKALQNLPKLGYLV
jgi:hypothetical protein